LTIKIQYFSSLVIDFVVFKKTVSFHLFCRPEKDGLYYFWECPEGEGKNQFWHRKSGSRCCEWLIIIFRLLRVQLIFELMTVEASRLARLLLPGKLAKHTVSEGTDAVTKYTSSK
jgi:hypothetical protein